MVIIRVGNNWPGSSVVRVMPRAHGPSQDAANGQEKIDRGVLGEVEDALDEATILAEDLEGKITGGTAVEPSEMFVATIFRGHSNRLKGIIVRVQE